MLVATELFGVNKILEAADTRADDELVASVREVFPFCKIFDKVPFDVPIVGLLCMAREKEEKIYMLYKIYIMIYIITYNDNKTICKIYLQLLKY